MPSVRDPSRANTTPLMQAASVVKRESLGLDGSYGTLFKGFYRPACATAQNDAGTEATPCVIKEPKGTASADNALLREKAALERIKRAGGHQNVQALLAFVHDVQVVFCCFSIEILQLGVCRT